jgi:CO/xanthine dehydrogenase Mo-binding subunit
VEPAWADLRRGAEHFPDKIALIDAAGRMPEEMHVAFVDRDAPPSGLGEIGNPWVAAAVANAFYRLTGKRLNHMPFTPARVLETLKS